MKKTLCYLATLALLMGLSVPTAFADDDLQEPEDVEGVEAVSGNEEVTLSWDLATDNVGVTGYKIYYGLDSVQEDGGSYTFGALETGDVLEYTVEGLENDVTYYFAMTALDEAGNESAYYSEEVSATPQGEGEDLEGPVILDATATADMVVEVTFDEEVVLPEDGASAFAIADVDTDEELDVLDAFVSTDDESVVLITTGTQDPEVTYILTAGTAITDAAGNPMISGTSDTATFEGGTAASEDEEEEEEEAEVDEDDKTAPEIDVVESTSVTEVVVTFDEEVMLDEEAPQEAFELTLAEDGSVLTVLSAMVSEEDGAQVVLETEEMAPGEDYILVVTGILDLAGNELTNTFDRTASFQAVTLDIADLIAPEDVTNFMASLVEDVSTSVELSWDASLDTAGDLADQLLYMSEDDGENYDDGESLGASAVSHDVDGLAEGMTYTFKLTVKDATGNESEGVITTVTLPETGAGLGAVLLATVLGTRALTRRKRK